MATRTRGGRGVVVTSTTGTEGASGARLSKTDGAEAGPTLLKEGDVRPHLPRREIRAAPRQLGATRFFACGLGLSRDEAREPGGTRPGSGLRVLSYEGRVIERQDQAAGAKMARTVTAGGQVRRRPSLDI